jgi:hypothetical protein
MLLIHLNFVAEGEGDQLTNLRVQMLKSVAFALQKQQQTPLVNLFF